MEEGTQRDRALRKAQDTRIYRANLKRQIKHGELGRADVLGLVHAPPPRLARMRVRELMEALPHFGATRTRQLLKRAGIAHDAKIEDLPDTLRGSLEVCLTHWPDHPPRD